MKGIAAVAVLTFLAPPVLAQESMAELAERLKKERKGKSAKSTEVITDHELRSRRTRAYVPASGDAAGSPQPQASPDAAGAPSGAAPAKSDDDVRAEKKAEIESKIKQWTDFIAETQKAMNQAQLELNDVSSLTFGSRRAGLQKIIDEGNQHLAEAQTAIAALEEEARRAGVAVSR